MKLFRSEALFLLLSNFTGLKLHFLAPSEEEEMNDKKRKKPLIALKKGLAIVLLSQRIIRQPSATTANRTMTR